MSKPSPFTQAFWIWPDSHHWDIHNSYALFRKDVTLKKLPAQAPLFITADQAYQLFINGRFVCRGPARGFQASWPYDEIDVRPYLKSGGNIFAVRAHNPGYSNFQYQTQGYAGLLVAGKWGTTAINSDATWKSIRQSSVSRDTVPTSLQLFCQEHIDLRGEMGDWTSLDFDDKDWAAPVQVRWNSGPWFALEPRNIPMLKEQEVIPLSLLGEKEGTNAKGYERVRDVVALRYQEDRSHQPVQASFTPLAIAATGKGKFRSYLLDFGKTVVGNLLLKVDGTRGGEIIDTHHSETIDKKSLTPDLRIPTHCRMAFGDRLTCREGYFTHRFFHFYGFRYLCVTVRDAMSDFTLDLRLNWVGYPLETIGLFKSSDTELERIWEISAWTQQCCSLDAYVDTPWREQAQWWGDARVQAWNTFYLDGDARLLRRGIAQIAGQTTFDGVTYGHAPTMAHSCILPDFTLMWILTIWDYYWQTGSVEPLFTHHATVQNALTYFRKFTDPQTGLVTNDQRYWLFLDWTDLFKDGASSVYNLWLLIALEKLALLYRKAKQPSHAAPLEKWAAKLRRALTGLVDEDGLLRDGIDRRGRVVKGRSVHAQTLALMTNLQKANLEAILEQVLLPSLQSNFDSKALPSSYWLTYVFSELAQRGHAQEVIEFIKRHWSPMIEHGTTWEGFEPDPGNGSSSHAWSAHPLFHLMQTIGGIRQTGPAWSEVTFSPVFHGTYSRTEIPTPHGLIRTHWRKTLNQVEVQLELPAKVKARIKIPGIPSQLVLNSWSKAFPADQAAR